MITELLLLRYLFPVGQLVQPVTQLVTPAMQYAGMTSGGIASGATILTQSAAAEIGAVKMEAGKHEWQVQSTSDVSEFLRKMNAERIHLEQGLQREEESETHKLLMTHVCRHFVLFCSL